VSHYVIRGGLEGQKRLALLGRTLWPTTSDLLERAGLAAGMTCLDLGCGGGDVALCLAEWVGPSGTVVGLDIDATKVELAREQAAEVGVSNVRFEEGDATTWSESGQYDFIYCRFLLTHLPQPEPLLLQMWAALKPGGRVAVEDIDFAGHFCFPPNRAFERYVELYGRVVARRGGDAEIGRRLFDLAGAAGWTDRRISVIQPTFFESEGKELGLVTLRNVADAILAEGLATEDELRATIDEFQTFVADPQTIVSLPRIFQVWASRNPASRELNEIALRCARLKVLDSRSPDEIVGYDELGLPA
jgi:SAM-dependent methyltransferase